MAATGGGKIRSRRYHIASKPYAKSKQQPGLISRVTDRVKSIVPSWLQKYFKNEEDVEAGGPTAGVVQNNLTPPLNGSEERALHIDEQDSQEPSTSNTEPSSSKATLKFQESHVLSRPPLSRSHLHFPPLDASSPVLGGSSSSLGLFSHPSTSAPGPFSTGIGAFTGASSASFSLVKEIKDNCSQHEDDNISTTSGFSSRASEKDVPTSKTASIPQLWSPETDRTHSGPQRSQSSLKKPAFNLSVFGTSTNSTMNSSVLNSSQLGDSPFYPGKTTYGGAAAVRTAYTRPGTPYQAPLRRQIKAKPAGAQPCGVTSATARRILQSLERMSSPLADAKRIPSAAAVPMSAKLDCSYLDISHFQAKKKKMDPSLPPVQRLVIPAAASVSGNRSMSFKPSLTPGGLGRAVDRTPRDTPTRQSPLIPDVTAVPPQSTSSLPYPLSSTPVVSATTSGGGKMKRERTSTRPSSKRSDEEEVTEVPDLPSISLPISAFSLPTFTFSNPPTTTSVTPTVTAVTPAKEPASEKEPPTASTPPCDPFTFSSPIVMATAASPPSFSPSAGFTFSVPVARAGTSVSNGNIDTPLTGAVKTTSSESTEEFEGPFKPAKVLKQGSVLDLLKAPGFASPVSRSSPGPDATSPPTPTVTTAPSASTGFGDLFKAPAGSWDCDICMVQNKPTSAKCVACSSPQPNSSSSSKPSDSKLPATTAAVLGNSTTTTTTTPTGFGGLFTTPAGTWDCDTCLVQNKPDAVKCVACETAKPGSGVKPSLTLPVVSEAKTLSTSKTAPNAVLGFGDKFKKVDGAWECETCMVENKGQDTTCVACMSAKPGASVSSSSTSAPDLASITPLIGFGDKFKKPEGAWECDTCCVQNKAADVRCVSCQTVKPGAKVEPTAFGSSSFGTSDSGGFNGGSSSDSSSGSGSFKFGSTLANSSSSSSSVGFKFGTSSSDSSTTGGFKFGASTESFKFGDSSTAVDSDKKADPPTMGAGFKFGGSIAFGIGADTMESKPSGGGFTFGQSTSDAKTAAAPTTTTLPSSAFSFGAASQEKSKSEASTTAVANVSTTSAPVFGTPTESNSTATASLGGSAFGAPAEKEPAAPSFTFGNPEVKEAPSMTSGFLFSAANNEPEASPAPSLGGFSFSKPDPPKEQDKPSFTFGKPPDVAATPAAETPKPSFSFGQSATDTSAAPPFGFMASTSSTASTTAPAPSLFGSPSSSTPASNLASTPATGTFMFGQSSSSDGPPAKAFMFGQNQESQPVAPAGALNAAPVSAQPFLFGNVATAAPTASTFTFGAAASSTASSAAPSAAPSPFVFSSAPTSGFGTGQAPSFGQVSTQSSAPAFGSPAPSPFTAAVSQSAAFGAKPNAAPVFGQQANATPVFGATTNSTAVSGGFQFGGASAFGAPSGSTGVFAFGAGSGAPPAPTATPSIVQPPSAPGGGFSFTQPPSFNMGAVNSNFTATPATQQAIAGRKIKTAIRRRK